jgi:hypothetical protein
MWLYENKDIYGVEALCKDGGSEKEGLAQQYQKEY